ncbi:ferroxidase fet3 [Coemansia brasiliensis]|uniref:Ferroxidase fet3 n=1 Tax=Coemansia brasiliensis TaxID=2650707 RepID=A0A9W8LX27_9FUNG|nr:ferroxidase fet3 [Coemansia brasiliensis]
MLRFKTPLLLLLAFAWLINAARVEVDWKISRILISRDGRKPWDAIGVNGKQPVKPIHVTQGDVLALNVHNGLDEPTSLHFQGLLQNGTSYMDGTGMVTECGIPPNESFTYLIDTKDQVGTYSIQGHINFQYADGLRGLFIIHERYKPVAEYDEELIMTFEDWTADKFMPRMEVFQTIKTYMLPQNYPNGLINGIDGNRTEAIKLTPGKRYRLRLVSLAMTYWFTFRIPGHKLYIIEADGVDTEPFEVDSMDIGPTQRYSVLLTAYDTDEFNYVYDVSMYANFIIKSPGINPHNYQGLVQYSEHAPIKNVPQLSEEEMIWPDDTKLVPVNKQVLLSADKSLKFKEGGHGTGYGITYFGMGNVSYEPALVPALFSAFSMGDLALDSRIYGPQVEAHVLPHLKVIELDLHNPSMRDHLFVLHGHSFQIVEFGPSGNATAENKPVWPVRRPSKWPMRRDTVVVRTYEYVKLRFRADNPGVWLLSEGVLTHFYKGVGVTFIEAPDILQQTQKLPEELKQMCLKQGIKASGNGAGNEGYDLSGLSPAIYLDE